jgi:hypothetical protein
MKKRYDNHKHVIITIPVDMPYTMVRQRLRKAGGYKIRHLEQARAVEAYFPPNSMGRVMKMYEKGLIGYVANADKKLSIPEPED